MIRVRNKQAPHVTTSYACQSFTQETVHSFTLIHIDTLKIQQARNLAFHHSSECSLRDAMKDIQAQARNAPEMRGEYSVVNTLPQWATL